jgi:P-type conjugative transfer ATPase TrbB
MVYEASAEEREESARRHREALARALGAVGMAALKDREVNEIYLNPESGALYADTRSRGRVAAGATMPPERAMRFLNLAASGLGTVINSARPALQGELPRDVFLGARLQGFLPPLASSPCFNIRKPSSRVCSLDQYVESGVLAPAHRHAIGEAVRDHRNILIAGGTASGKTTLANAVLLEISTVSPAERIVILEDTVELQCMAADHLALRTTDTLKLRDLVKAALRASPDRIVVGEVRDEAALDLCDAWETGHPGGCATVHANDALGALQRLDRLAQRNAGIGAQGPLVAAAIDLVVVIEGGSRRRCVVEVAEVEGWAGDFRLKAVGL